MQLFEYIQTNRYKNILLMDRIDFSYDYEIVYEGPAHDIPEKYKDRYIQRKGIICGTKEFRIWLKPERD